MTDIKSFIYGVVASLVAVIIVKLVTMYRQKTIIEDINHLKFEKNHLAEMKRSSVEMNRSSFQAIFSLFILLGLAQLLTSIASWIDLGELNSILYSLITALWIAFLVLSIKFIQRYKNLKNYKEAFQEMEEKLTELHQKSKK